MKARTLVGSLMFAVVLLLVSVPSAQALRPTRTIEDATGGVFPAGMGCSFRVRLEPADGASVTTIHTEFSDGRFVRQIRDGYIKMTNLKTGKSIVHHSQYSITETYDPVTNQVYLEANGTYWDLFLPGDVGPFGVVAKPGLLLSVTAHEVGTYDIDADRYVLDEFKGKVNFDICAALS